MSITGYVTVVKVDGTDVTDKIIEFSIDDSSENVIDTARIAFTQDILVTSGVDLDPGSEVTIQRGPSTSSLIYIFRGYITASTPKSASVDVQCSNKLWLLKQRQVTKSFDRDIDTEAGVLSEIVLTLVTTYGGLTADATTIQNSGTTNTLRKFICRNDSVFERIMKLVDTLDWQFYYNPQDDKVYFEPWGYRQYSTTLYFTLTGSNMISNTLPVLNKDFTKLYNKITVNGAKQLDTRSESFTATGGQTVFTLSFTPLQTKVTVAGTLKTRGTLGSSDTYDYYVDETLNQVVFSSGLTVGQAVVIEYSAMVPVPVVVDDPGSIDAYCPTNATTGEKTPFEKQVTYNDIINVDDAILRARKLLTQYSEPIITYSATLTQDRALIFPGYTVDVNDQINKYNGSLVVRKVTRHYPEPFDAIELGDKRMFYDDDLVDVSKRLELLEKESLRNTSVLVHLKQYARRIKYERRYFKLFKVPTSGTIMQWDHVATGKWDTYKWATDNTVGSEVLQQVVPGQNSFKEYFYDTTFIDTSTSTAMVDTTNKRVIN